MTLVVGMHLGSYVMMAADSRCTYFDHTTGEEVVDDEYRKVHATNSGLISGSGLTHITDWLMGTLKEYPKASPAEIQEAMQLRTQSVISQMPSDARIQAAGAQTGWILATTRRKRLEMEFYHSSTGFEAQSCNIGFPLTLLPVDAGMDKFERPLMELKVRMRPQSNLKKLDASLQYHLELLCQFMRDARTLSAVLGPSIQVGYYTEREEMEVLADLVPIDDGQGIAPEGAIDDGT